MVGKRIGRCPIAKPIYHPIPNMTTPPNPISAYFGNIGARNHLTACAVEGII